MNMMIFLNGEQYDLEEGATIESLLEKQGLTGRRLAVEVGEAIIPKSRHAECVLNEGDKVEIVHAIGGGSVA